MINEETRVQLQSPGTLQKVMDEFLSFTGNSSGLPAEVEEAESQVAIVRARLGQSQDDETGSGQYGVIDLNQHEAQSVLLAIQTVGTQQDTSGLSSDISRLKMVREGISGRGSEPTAKGAEGWEVQNQGVTRRAPGEGPSVNGGRTQSQEMDSYDQPQYEAYDWKRDHDSFDVQDTRIGSQEVGEVTEDKGADMEWIEHGRTLKKAGLTTKQAKKASSGIAADHRKEDPNYYKNESTITLKEFFSFEEK